LKLTGQSIRNYITATAIYTSLLMGNMPQELTRPHSPTNVSSCTPKIHEKIMQQTFWSRPEQLKEPFTYQMLAAHTETFATKNCDYSSTFPGLAYSVWDWLQLGVFTGSRLAKYTQSNPRADSSEWVGMALAFIVADFMF
jgi:hypothetical protein